MTDPAAAAQRLAFDGLAFGWALALAFSAKLVAFSGSAAITLGWELLVLFLIPLFLPLRFLVISVLAAIIFLDASLWFRQGAFITNTIYESPGAWIKPPELLFAALTIRVLHMRDLPKGLPQSIKLAVAGFALFILIGGATALFYGTALAEILTFSEIRSPLIMVIGLVLLAPLARLNPQFFCDAIGSLLLAHFAISLLSWGAGFSILWQSYASNYAGSTAAFFGGDESVMVYLLGQALALGVILSKQPKQLSRFGRRFWWLVAAVATFALLASLRRGGVLGSTILLLFVFSLSGFGSKLRMATFLFVSLPFVAAFATQSGVAEALLARFAGQGTVAVSDFGRETDVIQARAYIAEHFWFGSGAATKLALLRTQAYGVAESLSIHHAIYHIWVRFGVFGAGFYALLFGVPFVHALKAFWRSGKAGGNTAYVPLTISMSGLIVALYVWGLHIPAIFINFRQAGVWIIATTLIYATTWPIKPVLADTSCPAERAE